MSNFWKSLELHLNSKHSGDLYRVKKVRFEAINKKLNIMLESETLTNNDLLHLSFSDLMGNEPYVCSWPYENDLVVMEQTKNNNYTIYNIDANCYLISDLYQKIIDLSKGIYEINTSNRVNVLYNFGKVLLGSNKISSEFNKSVLRVEAIFDCYIKSEPFSFKLNSSNQGTDVGIWLRLEIQNSQLKNPIISGWFYSKPGHVIPRLPVNTLLKIEGEFIYPIGYIKIFNIDIGKTTFARNQKVDRKIFKIKKNESYTAQSIDYTIEKINDKGWDELLVSILFEKKMNQGYYKIMKLHNPFGYLSVGENVRVINRVTLESEGTRIRIKGTSKLRLHSPIMHLKDFFLNELCKLLGENFEGIVVESKILNFTRLTLLNKFSLIYHTIYITFLRKYKPNVEIKETILLAKIELTNNGIFGLYYKGFFDNVPNIGENVKVKGRLNKRNKIIFASKIKVQFDSPASFKNINPLIIEGHIHSSQLVQFSNNPKYQKYLCEKCRLLNDYQDVIWYQTGRKDLFIPKYRLLIEDYNKNILTCFFEPEWFLPDLTNYAECPIPPRNSGFWDSYLRRMWKQLSKQLFTRPMLGMIVPFPSILTNNLVKFQCKENTDGSYDILWLHNLTSKTVSYKSQYSNYKYHELKNIPTSSTIEGYILEEPKEVSLFQSIAPLLLNKNIELTTIYNPITGQQYVTDKGEFFEIIQQYRIVSIILQVETNNNNIVSVALDPRVNSGYYNKTKNTWENPTILSENMKIKISGHFSINGVLIGNDIQIL